MEIHPESLSAYSYAAFKASGRKNIETGFRQFLKFPLEQDLSERVYSAP